MLGNNYPVKNLYSTSTIKIRMITSLDVKALSKILLLRGMGNKIDDLVVSNLLGGEFIYMGIFCMDRVPTF